MKTMAERFWPKVHKTETCWLWTGYKTDKGYGAIETGWKSTKRRHQAHRVAYELIVGPIPDGQVKDSNRLYARRCPVCLRDQARKKYWKNPELYRMRKKKALRPAAKPQETQG